jgi:hypothetical protein
MRNFAFDHHSEAYFNTVTHMLANADGAINAADAAKKDTFIDENGLFVVRGYLASQHSLGIAAVHTFEMLDSKDDAQDDLYRLSAAITVGEILTFATVTQAGDVYMGETGRVEKPEQQWQAMNEAAIEIIHSHSDIDFDPAHEAYAVEDVAEFVNVILKGFQLQQVNQGLPNIEP